MCPEAETPREEGEQPHAEPARARKPGGIWDAAEESFGDPGPDPPLPVPKQSTFTLSSRVQYFSRTTKLPRPGGAQGDIEVYAEVKSAGTQL